MAESESSIDGDSEYDSDSDYRIAQQEWEDSLQQLQLLITVFLLPFVGKWLGRKWSHLAHARYQRLGLGWAFFFGEKYR